MLKLTIDPLMFQDMFAFCEWTTASFQESLSQHLHAPVKIVLYDFTKPDQKIHRDFNIAVRSKFLFKKNTIEFNTFLTELRGKPVVPERLLFKSQLTKKGKKLLNWKG